MRRPQKRARLVPERRRLRGHVGPDHKGSYGVPGQNVGHHLQWLGRPALAGVSGWLQGGASMRQAGYSLVKLYFQAAMRHQETALQQAVPELMKKEARRVHRAATRGLRGADSRPPSTSCATHTLGRTVTDGCQPAPPWRPHTEAPMAEATSSGWATRSGTTLVPYQTGSCGSSTPDVPTSTC